MTCAAELHRAFPSRELAIQYLARRGFLCGVHGWENGRWLGSIEFRGHLYLVSILLRMPQAA